MKKKIITFTLCATVAMAIAGCGKVDPYLRVEPTTVAIEETEYVPASRNSMSYDSLKQASFVKNEPTKPQSFVGFDDFLAAEDVMKDIKNLKEAAKKQGGELNVLSDISVLELRFTFNEQAVNNPQDLSNITGQISSDVMDQRDTFEIISLAFFKYIQQDHLTLVLSYYDKDGTELYFKQLDFNRK